MKEALPEEKICKLRYEEQVGYLRKDEKISPRGENSISKGLESKGSGIFGEIQVVFIT